MQQASNNPLAALSFCDHCRAVGNLKDVACLQNRDFCPNRHLFRHPRIVLPNQAHFIDWFDLESFEASELLFYLSVAIRC